MQRSPFVVNSVFAVVIETVLIAGRTRMEGNSDGRTRVENKPGRQNQCGRPELRRTENYILGTIADLRDFDERFRVL